jgi:alkylation response protein AidB-like acyl-CoA dehydrogenase
MALNTQTRGGDFLIRDISLSDLFTPEDFTKEQRLIAKSAEEFGLGEIVPKRAELSELNPDLLKTILKKAGELGFLGADIPEIYGGSGLDKVSASLITEYISQGICGFSVTYAVQTGIGSLPIILFGTPDQKKRYLPRLASAEIIGAYALTEPGHGSDALRAETRAVLSPDGQHYILNGQKQFITNAGFADLFLTYAQVNETQFTSFIVERQWPGVALDAEEKKMGMHGTSTRAVIFQDVKVPITNVLGAVGKGHIVALNTLNIGRYKLGAICMGVSKVVLGEAVKYAKTRVQFGKPICEFGLIKHKLAEMIVKIYVNESMIYRTAGLLDKALEGIDPTQDEAGNLIGEALRRYAVECSINKVFGSETLDFVTNEYVQIMGGYGYIQDYPAEAAYRDARINRIWEGTNEINRLLIIDMLMKASLKGELPLLPAVKKAAEDLLGLMPKLDAEQGILEKEQKMVSMAKKVALLSAGAAIQKYMQKLGNEQELVALIADMVIEIFAMESALLRTLKKINREGLEPSRIQIAATQVYIQSAFPKLDQMAKEIFSALSQGEELKTQLMGLKKLTRFTPDNLIKIRREIAESILPIGKYHLTRL